MLNTFAHQRRFRLLAVVACLSASLGYPGTSRAETESTQSATDDPSDRVLRHAVFFTMKDSTSAEDIQHDADAFAALPSKIDSIIDFQWGTNNSPEGLDDGFTHCFLLSFKD